MKLLATRLLGEVLTKLGLVVTFLSPAFKTHSLLLSPECGNQTGLWDSASSLCCCTYPSSGRT